ncbi:hypothetical protein COR50_02000 [Chitinophaga caeni]|uniref:Uncharacterized protein n=1 Tax=Chitinophaga caeni TaxID=2029983 RepID=A0A291QPZ9_9BACT|nr:hypothetical protein [Chitinophaga caeni]ATL46030.1 hypothetical protein COR50_02000 [Chitinophaga caeni]
MKNLRFFTILKILFLIVVVGGSIKAAERSMSLMEGCFSQVNTIHGIYAENNGPSNPLGDQFIYVFEEPYNTDVLDTQLDHLIEGPHFTCLDPLDVVCCYDVEYETSTGTYKIYRVYFKS